MYSGTPLYGHPVNTDAPLLRTLGQVPLVSVLTGFHCTFLFLFFFCCCFCFICGSVTCGFPGVHKLEMPVSLFLRQAFTRCLGGGFSFGDHILFNFAYLKPSWSSKLRNRKKNDNEVLLAYFRFFPFPF